MSRILLIISYILYNVCTARTPYTYSGVFQLNIKYCTCSIWNIGLVVMKCNDTEQMIIRRR